MLRNLLLTMAVMLAASTFAQTLSQQASVELNATVQASPARITLTWTSLPSTTSITIYRKSPSATSWGSPIADPGASSTSYQDNSVVLYTSYEYRVVRVANGKTGQGYISSGIEVSLSDFKGKMILLVDNTFTNSLSPELAQLTKDLRADGWAVLRSDVSRTASVTSVRNTVIAHYNTDPSNVKAVFIVGHVPVPYSGNVNPDGHSSHLGAWPCDGYYGELNGTWTDNSVNNNGAQLASNRNVPGDGKFDQSTFPSALELQVGRVDMYDMPAFAQNETELMRAYLVKLHNYKVKQWSPQKRALLFDNFFWLNNPLAASGWRNLAPNVGAANVVVPNVYAGNFNTLVSGQSYLWTYSCGAGLQTMSGSTLTYNGMDLGGTTQNYAAMSAGGVFNMSMGSYFGDWDNKNNFLRAPLASGSGLTSVWSAIPAWYFHHMAMGENIGRSAHASMNNTGLYTPANDGWQSSVGTTHLALMGDPSLRQSMIAPPTNLTITNASGAASFSWTAAPGSPGGYHVYRFNSGTGFVTRLTTTPVTGTTFNNGTIPFEAGAEYMVRAIKVEVTPSGSFYNLSLGAIASASGAASADCQGVVGGTAVPGTACNDNNPCTINDTWNASCQCVGTNITPVATITPGGGLAFCSGGSVVLNATTGSGYSYLWKRNNTTISGATGSSYTATLAGSYTVTVSSGACSVTSSVQTVTVGTAPPATITAAGSTTFCSGGSVTLNANTGSGYTYAWRRNGSTIGGATSSSYVATLAGGYTLIVTSSGCATSSATVNVTLTNAPAATLTAAGPTGFCTGGSVVLNASTGTGYTYVWKRNSSNISGATGSSYTATQAGSYTVTVSGGGCTVTSTAVVVFIGTAPSATVTANGSTTFCSGGSRTLNANTGSGLTYLWKRNGTTISGATASSYAATLAGSYTVTVSSSGCATTSPALSLSVAAPPIATCTTNATNNTVSVVASGGLAPYTYNWSMSPAQTAATATVTASGNYTVVVTDARGCTTTCSANIIIASAGGCAGTRTESQAVWAANASGTNPAAYMANNFAAAFPASEYLTIGCGWRKLRLTSAAAVKAFLPSTGSVAQLPFWLLQNPGSSYSNAFAGELVALKLSVRFDELAPAFSPSPVLLKNMVIASGTFSGWSVAQLISAADAKIGSCSSNYSREQLYAAVAAVNAGYLGGAVNSGYLVCPSPQGMMMVLDIEEEMTLPGAELEVSVFPNPASDIATLLIRNTAPDQGTRVEVYSLNGLLIQAAELGTVDAGVEQRFALDVSNMSAGIYFYKVVSGDRFAAGRVVVEK